MNSQAKLTPSVPVQQRETCISFISDMIIEIQYSFLNDGVSLNPSISVFNCTETPVLVTRRMVGLGYEGVQGPDGVT